MQADRTDFTAHPCYINVNDKLLGFFFFFKHEVLPLTWVSYSATISLSFRNFAGDVMAEFGDQTARPPPRRQVNG